MEGLRDRKFVGPVVGDRFAVVLPSRLPVAAGAGIGTGGYAHTAGLGTLGRPIHSGDGLPPAGISLPVQSTYPETEDVAEDNDASEFGVSGSGERANYAGDRSVAEPSAADDGSAIYSAGGEQFAPSPGGEALRDRRVAEPSAADDGSAIYSAGGGQFAPSPGGEALRDRHVAEPFDADGGSAIYSAGGGQFAPSHGGEALRDRRVAEPSAADDGSAIYSAGGGQFAPSPGGEALRDRRVAEPSAADDGSAIYSAGGGQFAPSPGGEALHNPRVGGFSAADDGSAIHSAGGGQFAPPDNDACFIPEAGSRSRPSWVFILGMSLCLSAAVALFSLLYWSDAGTFSAAGFMDGEGGGDEPAAVRIAGSTVPGLIIRGTGAPGAVRAEEARAVSTPSITNRLVGEDCASLRQKLDRLRREQTEARAELVGRIDALHRDLTATRSDAPQLRDIEGSLRLLAERIQPDPLGMNTAIVALREPAFRPIAIRTLGTETWVSVIDEQGLRHLLRRGDRVGEWRLVAVDLNARTAEFESRSGQHFRSTL